MKKIFITISLLLAAVGICRADFVNENTVKEIANRWFGSSDYTVELNDSRSLYYVNATEGGWIVISAEDSTAPVVAYNDSGSFSPKRMPSNIKAWMESTYIKGIKAARADKLQASEPVKALWKTAGIRTKAASKKVLETALWDQESPYNQYCPSNTLTGCVATSACIIIRYHEWPETGRGTTEKYTADQGYKAASPIDLSAHSYDYSLMPLKYTSSATTDQKQQVARLMADMGAACKLSYGTNSQGGTGGYAEDLLNAFVYHFKYNPQASTAYKGSYTDAEWIALIKHEIDNNGPVPYGGYDDDPYYGGGHQYLCDGYDEKDYLHINWGWSGVGNGFFTFDMDDGSGYTFDKGHSIIINLYPDKSGDNYKSPNGGPLIYIDNGGTKGGLSISSGTVMSKNFTVKLALAYNADWYNSYSGHVRIALVDHKGDVKEAISTESSLSISPEQAISGKSFKCTVTNKYAIGDRIVCQFVDKTGNWADITADPEYCSGVNAIPVFDTPYLAERTEYFAGDNYVVDLIPGSKHITSYTWKLDGKTQSHVSANLSAGEHTVVVTVTLSDSSKFVITKKITAN